MLELKRGGRARVQTESRIYRLACPVLKKISNLVISRRNRAGTAKICYFANQAQCFLTLPPPS